MVSNTPEETFEEYRKRKSEEEWYTDRWKRRRESLYCFLILAGVAFLIGGCCYLVGEGEKDNLQNWKQQCRDNGFEVVNIQRDVICVDEGKTVLRYSERSY